MTVSFSSNALLSGWKFCLLRPHLMSRAMSPAQELLAEDDQVHQEPTVEA